MDESPLTSLLETRFSEDQSLKMKITLFKLNLLERDQVKCLGRKLLNLLVCAE